LEEIDKTLKEDKPYEKLKLKKQHKKDLESIKC